MAVLDPSRSAVTTPGVLSNEDFMPSPKMGGRGRSAIPGWRVKAGKREVFADPVKFKCEQFIREHDGKLDGVKLKLIPPNV